MKTHLVFDAIDFMEDQTVKYYYIAVQRQTDTGFYAYCIRVTNMDNIAQRMNCFAAANICTTKREAIEIAEAWNAQFIASGTHAFLNNRSDPGEESAELPF